MTVTAGSRSIQRFTGYRKSWTESWMQICVKSIKQVNLQRKNPVISKRMKRPLIKQQLLRQVRLRLASKYLADMDCPQLIICQQLQTQFINLIQLYCALLHIKLKINGQRDKDSLNIQRKESVLSQSLLSFQAKTSIIMGFKFVDYLPFYQQFQGNFLIRKCGCSQQKYIQLIQQVIHINIFGLMMLSTIEYKVKLERKYFKILYLSSAFKETFVFLGMQSSEKDVLVHCNKQGKILYEHFFQNSVDSFGMMNEQEVVVLETRKNKITVINLEKYEVTQYKHQFMNKECDQADIQTFSETQLLCVKEFGRQNDNRLRLSYYPYPLKEEKPNTVYESKNDEWNYEHHIKKGNNHSMIIWFKQRHDSFFQFKTFDLREDPKGIYHHYKIKNTIGEPYNMAKVECAVSTAWQTKRGQLLAVCITNKIQQKAVNSDGVVNNNFIIDLEKSIVRESKFYFQKRYNDYLIDYHNIGSISMFRTFQFDNGDSLPSPVYYINNQAEQIVASETWKCTYLTKYFVSGCSNSIMEGEYQNSNVQQFTLKIKKVMEPNGASVK